ncbi:MAG: aminomethyl-transferring glycine dehydrogenase subunit GcvPA [Bacillota bacterium]|nr:aminomethyl-transferring glycine dehydrogenase subunit GcvPA [Bacillota bacterium]
MASYIPHSGREQQEMLQEIGLASTEDLFVSIPEEVRLRPSLDLPAGKAEMEVLQDMKRMADRNTVFRSIFRGAGAYHRYIPAMVSHVLANETLQTAYTPYQAEISQGVLQSIFEYQTGICELTGMDVSNASVYDGATAAAEAVAMCRDRKRNRALVSAAVAPGILNTIRTYCFGNEMDLQIIPVDALVTDAQALQEMIDEQTACVLVQHPNYFGSLEDMETIEKIVHGAKAKLIMSVDPISLGVLKTPGEYGADAAVGEGQSLGMPLAFGGPYLGFMAAADAMKRKLPGRIVGQTTDADGKTGYVLTLQAREQHIRREKASSNICSNQALCALAAGVYLAAMGPRGLADAASQSVSKAHYLAGELEKIGFRVENEKFFSEFVTSSERISGQILSALEAQGILGGLPLDGHRILWCCTEMNSRQQIDEVIEILKEVG